MSRSNPDEGRWVRHPSTQDEWLRQNPEHDHVGVPADASDTPPPDPLVTEYSADMPLAWRLEYLSRAGLLRETVTSGGRVGMLAEAQLVPTPQSGLVLSPEAGLRDAIQTSGPVAVDDRPA